jgi:mono/diheme cytochrome c family protein
MHRRLPSARTLSRRLLVAAGLVGAWALLSAEAIEARAMIAMPPPPSFDPRVQGEVVSRQNGPPPISGGTLTALSDGARVVISDPDLDRVQVVSVAEGRVLATLSQRAGAEPGRSVEDAQHRVHVVLRGTGELLSFDPSAPDAASTRRVCGMPRGLAYDEASDAIVVACRDGELVSLPARGGAATRRIEVAHDLRDVLVRGERLIVTRFRSAEVLELDRTSGRELSRRSPASVREGESSLAAAVAWRAIALPSGEIAMLHQRESEGEVRPSFGGYRSFGGCDGIVRSSITLVGEGALVPGPTLSEATLPVDLAARRNGDGSLASLAVVAAGNQTGDHSVFIVTSDELRREGCAGGGWVGGTHALTNAVAVAYLPDGTLAVQTRAPSRLYLVAADGQSSRALALGGRDSFDTGHAIFHANAGGNVACASCHPEGGEDGHVWRFADLGPRRTPALHDAAGTAPFHWEGDLPTIHALFTEVFVRRMGGQSLPETHSAALEGWLGHVRRPVSHQGDAARVARGRALFEGDAGCAECHSGAHLSDGRSHDVGTGRAFQTPSLIGASDRLPLMHDGCASTLRARFEPSCGGASHGERVEGEELEDLLAYLASL